MSVVSSTNRGDVRIISIDNPPVNATSAEVRKGLRDAFGQAGRDPAVRAVVLACAGRTFVAGADIREFGKPPVEPHLSAVIDQIEQLDKPVVAAIQGTALGGGLELAMGCHYRVADRRARMGLPESTLGVVPGAGGIARLMRLAGAAAAAQLSAEGTLVGAEQAVAMGLADTVADGDLLDAAVACAERLAREGGAVRRSCDLPVADVPDDALDALRKKYAKTLRGQAAPQVCIDIVDAGRRQGFRDNVELARTHFRELVASPQAEALRHAFFAQRVAVKGPDLPKVDVGIRRAGVIGAGTMGTGIALCFLNAGYEVLLMDQSPDVLQRSRETIVRTLDADVAKARASREQADARLARLETGSDYEALRDCQIVIEAVFEDIDIKSEVLARIDAVVDGSCIVASNTSYLDIDVLAEPLRHRENVVGMHFFSPAHIMKLVENVRTRYSSPEVLARVQALGARLGKVPVMVGVSDGFVGNRMLSRRMRECHFLIEEGALPHEVDAALRGFGFPMGQFQLNDLAGLDVAWRNRQSRLSRLSEREQAFTVLDELVAQGRLGQKTSAGYYRYDDQRRPSVDPEVTALIERHAGRRAIVRREIQESEILERCLYIMINEAAQILEEGVASRPEEIDTIWLNGYGFPRYRGGPLFHADRVGIPRIVERIRHYADLVGERYWALSPRLERMARNGERFYGQ